MVQVVVVQVAEQEVQVAAELAPDTHPSYLQEMVLQTQVAEAAELGRQHLLVKVDPAL